MNLLYKIAKAGLSQGVHIPSSSRYIFTYHDVSDFDTPHYSDLYSTPIERFYEHIDLLSRYFEFASLDYIVALEQKRKRLAAITFDDGFFSVKETVMPYLVSRGIPFSVFVNQTAIKKNYLPYDLYSEINRHHETKVYLEECDIKGLHEKGIIVGSHTSNHSTLVNCSLKMLQDEVTENKSYLEKLLNTNIAHFAFPYGKKEHYDEAAVIFCRSIGHLHIYNTNPVYFKSSTLKDNLSLIPRLGLTNQSKEELLFLINRPLVKKIDI